ncbi:MAG: hypothetical protein BRD55_09465 [Bacteroidetes bacterium SW_9_63_38]|nr:MAG: hypothetical protein BRD55_09465 [Bacteroidetes bacterium SW_9_63_38]
MSTFRKIAEDFALMGKRLLERAEKTWRLATSPLRELPNVVIIGTQKGGTTSLYHYLCQHPRIGGALSKELHYFNLEYKKHRLWYRSNFDLQGNRISLEATPDYIFDENTLWRMSRLIPEAKLIAVLRDPVSRAYSQYNHVQRGMGNWGADPRSFEEAVQADIRFARENRVIGRSEYEDIFHSYVRRGIYAPQIRRFKKVYGDQLLVLRSEDLFSDPNGFVNSIFEWLGIEQRDLQITQKYGRGNYKKEVPMRKELEDFFEPHNRKLYELLGVKEWWSY